MASVVHVGITADENFDAFPCTDKRTEDLLSVVMAVTRANGSDYKIHDYITQIQNHKILTLKYLERVIHS